MRPFLAALICFASAVLADGGILFDRAKLFGGIRLTEGNSLASPSLFICNNSGLFALSYSAPFAGLGDNIDKAGVGYWHSLKWFTAGASWSLLKSDIYSMNDLKFDLSRRIGRTAFGARGRLFYDSFLKWNFEYGSEDNPNDPIFAGGYSKAAFSIDLSVAIAPTDRLFFALSAENLLNPDLAIRDNLQSGLGREFKSSATVFTSNTGTFSAGVGYSPSAPDGTEFLYELQYRTPKLAQAIDLQMGLDERDVSLGLGLAFKWGIPLYFDYRFDFHRGDIGRVSSGHNFALSGLIESRVLLPDLSVALLLDKERYHLGDQGFIAVEIQAGGGDFEDVSVALNLNGFALDTLTRSSVISGVPSVIRIPFDFDPAGVYIFEVYVDPNNNFAESDETNNYSRAVANVYAPPSLDIQASPMSVKVDAAKYLNQDESIVPAVFFEIGSSQIDPRFDALLELLAERLKENPDAVLVVNGYFDELSEPGSRPIGENRASAVISALTKLAPSTEARIITGGDSPERQRIPRRSQYQEYQRLVDAENRRAEISVIMPPVEFKLIDAEFSPSDAIFIADSTIKILRANPMAMLVVRASSAGGALDAAILRALEIKELLLASLPEYYSDRVLAGADENIPAGEIVVFVTGDAIAFKPREVHSALSYEPSELPDCEISISAASETGISEWRVSLVDESGREAMEIATGKGAVEKILSWDWKDRQGGIIPFGKRFSLCLEAIDELGQASKLCTDKDIGTEVLLREERIDRLLLVQFIFDGPSAQSSFLEDRLEWVARHIVEKGAQAGVSISAELQGHTDEIGGHRRNTELSEQRAKAVEARLFAYMKGLLGLDSREALDRWMAENEVSISSRGYAASEPYEIEFWETGKLIKRVIGKSDFPEGRTINRRVVVVITETRGTADE